MQGAYRVSGAVARVFYVTPKKRDHLLEMDGKLGVNEPYGIYTRRLNSRTVREPEHDDPKWNELTRIQYHPVDSTTGQDLPRCFSFIRKIALYLHGATQNELTLKFTPQSMKNWIRTGELNFRGELRFSVFHANEMLTGLIGRIGYCYDLVTARAGRSQRK